MALLLKSMELKSKSYELTISVNHCNPMPKPHYKTTNCKQYNKVLNNLFFLNFWIHEKAIAEYKQFKQGRRGRAL